MKKQRSVSLILSLFFLSSFLPGILRAEGIAEAKSDDSISPEERLEKLSHGDILTDGGYLKHGVWGHMEGVVQAPPLYVWRIFLQSNDWKNYKFPQMADSRAVSAEIAEKSSRMKNVEDFYSLIGDSVFDPTKNQVTGTVWHNYGFQLYDVPWPVSDKWIVVHNTNDETKKDQNIYRCDWERAGGNTRSLTGYIQLAPFEGDPYRTLLTYHVDTDPGSIVPKFLLKLGVKHSLPQAMQVIRRESIRLYGKPVPILKIQDRKSK